MRTLPRIISVDDHVLEPPDLWQDRIPAGERDRAPKLVRKHGVPEMVDGRWRIRETSADDDQRARWGEQWEYDGDVVYIPMVGFANIGPAREQKRHSHELITYEEMLPGCYDQAARLADMDLNHVEASLCFPTMPRFCGQTFLERADHTFALRCLRVYNDWMIDEWCGGPAKGRLIPLTLVPLWDPELAAEEVRRCAAKGSHAVTFAEGTDSLGLPSIYSGAWDPFLAACDETATVVNMHIGSSSTTATTSRDAPFSARAVVTFENAMHAAVDWILSGTLTRFPNIRISLTEGQAGWLPFVLERLDDVWQRNDMYEKDMRDRIPVPPSVLVRDRLFTCIFNDEHALRSRDVIGMEHLMFETDYPHSDSTFPNSEHVLDKLTAAAGLDDEEIRKLARGNAIHCFGLERFGITE